MATIATGSKTIIDLSDGKSLSCYLQSNQPRVQIYDVNAGTYQPDWTTSTGKLTITPAVYADQTAVPLSSGSLTVTWKRRAGSGSETALTADEDVSGNVLTVSQNKLAGVSSGLITYLAYIAYLDPDTNLTVNTVAQIDFALVRTGQNAKSVWIAGEQVFKYASSGDVSPSQITLEAHLQNVSMGKWQYRDAAGDWQNYPTTSDNATITSTSLVVKPTHAVWNNSSAAIRVTTSDSDISDVISLYKVSDGAAGTPGTPGTSAPMCFLTNENVTFAGNASGQVAATSVTCNVVAYRGTSKVTPTVGTVAGAPTGMTVSKGTATSNEIPLTISIAANSTLGGSGPQSGELSVPITSPVSTTLKVTWSKVNTGANGTSGTSPVVFSLYAPGGTVFVNGEGTLTLETTAYKGSTKITSGATYKWEKFSAGTWTTVSGTTGSLSVSGSSVQSSATYRCTMTYSGATYADCITLIDKTDNYQAVIDSTGGDIFKNAQGNSTLTCRLFQNGSETDLAGSAHSYKWYRMDKDGEALDPSSPWKTGKSISVTGANVNIKTTFICEVE